MLGTIGSIACILGFIYTGDTNLLIACGLFEIASCIEFKK